jgi:hypothetical protein
MNVQENHYGKRRATAVLHIDAKTIGRPLASHAKQRRPEFFERKPPYGFENNFGTCRFVNSVVVPEVLGDDPTLDTVRDVEDYPDKESRYVTEKREKTVLDMGIAHEQVGLLREHFRNSQYDDSLDDHLTRVLDHYVDEYVEQ